MNKKSGLFLSMLLIILISCNPSDLTDQRTPTAGVTSQPIGPRTGYTRSACISGVSFEFPSNWRIIDVRTQGVDAIIDNLAELDPESEWGSVDFGSASASDVLIIYAIDPEPIDHLFVTFQVTQEELPAPLDAGALAAQAIEAYEAMGFQDVSLRGEYIIQGIDAAMIRMGTASLKVQMIYSYGNTMTILTCSFPHEGLDTYGQICAWVANTINLCTR